MRAAVCRSYAEPLVIEELELAPPGPGEARVKMSAVAICHSDVHVIRGEWGGAPPRTRHQESSLRSAQAWHW